MTFPESQHKNSPCQNKQKNDSKTSDLKTANNKFSVLAQRRTAKKEARVKLTKHADTTQHLYLASKVQNIMTKANKKKKN